MKYKLEIVLPKQHLPKKAELIRIIRLTTLLGLKESKEIADKLEHEDIRFESCESLPNSDLNTLYSHINFFMIDQNVSGKISLKKKFLWWYFGSVAYFY